MKILVFGASGGTGQEIVRQGLRAEHAMTAFVRRPDAVVAGNPGLRTVVGDVLADRAVVAAAVRDQDAVISALGVRKSLKSGGLISGAMKCILPAMQRHGVGRLVVVSAFGVGDTARDASLLQRTMYRLLLRDIFADKKSGDEAIAATDLDWTILYPVLLTDGPETGRYRIDERLPMRGLPKISRADVAHACLALLGDGRFRRKGAVIRQ